MGKVLRDCNGSRSHSCPYGRPDFAPPEGQTFLAALASPAGLPSVTGLEVPTSLAEAPSFEEAPSLAEAASLADLTSLMAQSPPDGRQAVPWRDDATPWPVT